MRALAPPRLGG